MRVFKKPIFAEAPSSMGRGRTFFKIYSGLALLQGYAWFVFVWLVYPIHHFLTTKQITEGWLLWWAILLAVINFLCVWPTGGINTGRDGRCPDKFGAIINQWAACDLIWAIPTCGLSVIIGELELESPVGRLSLVSDENLQALRMQEQQTSYGHRYSSGTNMWNIIDPGNM